MCSSSSSNHSLLVRSGSKVRSAPAQTGSATSSAADAQAAGLAFTGSTIRLPVLIGVGLLVAGVLLLLKRRRQG